MIPATMLPVFRRKLGQAGSAALLVLIFHALHSLGWAAGAQPGIDELVKVAVHHTLHIARLHAGSQVFHHPVGLKDITANLIPPGDTPFLAVKTFHLRLLLIEALRVDPGEDQLHGRGPILVLRTLVLRSDDKSSWNMRNADRGLDLVDVLTALATGTKGIDLK